MKYNTLPIITTLNINISLFYKFNIGNVWITPICGYDTCTVVLADMSASMQMLYGQQCYFQILSIFSYDIFCRLSASQHQMVACLYIVEKECIHQ